jgi:hypothetical protein
MKKCLSFIGAVFAALLLTPVPSYAAAPAGSELVFESDARLNAVKANPEPYRKSLAKVVANAEAAIKRPVDTVVNKTQVPPSGDKHDYYSMGPYWWPNPDSADGMPWKSRDGEVNPMTRGVNTDQVRSADMFSDLSALNMAYYMTGEAKYAEKAKAILTGWFLDPETRMNPNLNHGQAVPGQNDGRPLGIIEWDSISTVVTAIQLLERNDRLSAAEKADLDKWLDDYFVWLTTSKLGLAEDAQPQNHGNWYDFQTIGLALYLGRTDYAKLQAEKAKSRRIEAQIEPDGSQPMELRRTKSVNYSSMNIWAMTRVAEMSKRVGVDLLKHKSADGRSIRGAIGYVLPYVNGEKPWEYKQIIHGGPDGAMDVKMRPMLAKAEIVWGEKFLNDMARNRALANLGPTERLSYGIPD